MKVKRHRNILEVLQRRVFLRVTSVYRTVSTIAVQVITETPPLVLQMEEQAEIFRLKVLLEKETNPVAVDPM